MKHTTVVALAAVSLFWMGLLFGHDDNVPEEVRKQENPVQASDEVLAKAQSAYKDSCNMCHGPEGKGDGPMAGMFKTAPADISKPELLGTMTDGEIYWIITKGKKPMPEFESKMTEQERWGLVHLMRKISNTPSNSTPSHKH